FLQTKYVFNQMAKWNLIIEPMPKPTSDLAGQTFVITGKFSLPRETIKERLQQKGAKVTGTVSANTTALLAGTDAGSKLTTAMKLVIPVYDETQFLTHLNYTYSRDRDHPISLEILMFYFNLIIIILSAIALIWVIGRIAIKYKMFTLIRG